MCVSTQVTAPAPSDVVGIPGKGKENALPSEPLLMVLRGRGEIGSPHTYRWADKRGEPIKTTVESRHMDQSHIPIMKKARWEAESQRALHGAFYGIGIKRKNRALLLTPPASTSTEELSPVVVMIVVDCCTQLFISVLTSSR